MKLFYRELVAKGQPLIILHGVFGSSDNWLTLAKQLAGKFHVYVPDQRNHGQSPHSEEFNYEVLADDIHEFLITNSISDPIIIGHSMGGKAAMKFALSNQELLSKLIIVDIAPRSYPVQHNRILEGLKSIPINTIETRSEADEVLAKYVDDTGVRQFLLKNLQRKNDGGFSWKINLPVLDESIENVGDEITSDTPFNKPTLFLKGSKSDYISESDHSSIKKLFPQASIVTLDSGHWIHAEKPQEFLKEVTSFLS